MKNNNDNQDWTISGGGPGSGLWALNDKKGYRVLLADTLAACEAFIADHNDINGDFTMLYHSVGDGALIPDSIFLNDAYDIHSKLKG